MRNTFLVMSHEIYVTLRRKSFVILALGLPLLLALVALVVVIVNRGASAEGAAGPAQTEVTSPSLEGYVDNSGLIRVVPADLGSDLKAYPDQATAQAALEAGEISAYYVVSADYVQRGDITYVRPKYNPISDDVQSGHIEWVLTYNLIGDPQLADAVRDPLDLTTTALKPADSGDEDSWIAEVFPNLMAFILYLSILIPSGMLVNTVTDEKKNRVIEVLLSTVSPQQMIGGKILALGLLGLLQTLLWVGLLWAVIRFGGRPLSIPAGFELPTGLVIWTLVYGLLGYAMYGAQMAGLGALAPELKETKGASFVVLAPIIGVYMFLIAIVTRPNSPLSIALSLFPLTSPVGMIARMTATEVPLWQPILAAGLQLLAAIWIVRLVARLFHAQALLSGQPFSVGRYFRALVGKA